MSSDAESDGFEGSVAAPDSLWSVASAVPAQRISEPSRSTTVFEQSNMSTNSDFAKHPLSTTANRTAFQGFRETVRPATAQLGQVSARRTKSPDRPRPARRKLNTQSMDTIATADIWVDRAIPLLQNPVLNTLGSVKLPPRYARMPRTRLASERKTQSKQRKQFHGSRSYFLPNSLSSSSKRSATPGTTEAKRSSAVAQARAFTPNARFRGVIMPNGDRYRPGRYRSEHDVDKLLKF